MALPMILWIVIFVVAIALGFWLLKKIVKIMFAIGLIILVIILVLGFYVYSDSLDIKENIVTTDSLFLLKNNNIETGFRARFSDKYTKGEPDIVSEEELAKINILYSENDLTAIKSDNYKIFIYNEGVFDDIDNIEFSDWTLDKDFMLDTINSENPMEMLAAELKIPRTMLAEQLEDDNNVRGVLFMQLFNAKLEKDGPLYLITEFKKKNIVIYPETAVFKAAKIFPVKYFDRFLEKIRGDENGSV
ncbi:hypothetical protein KY328_04255 [Candidatus Woesearchaeota archaeon]|nr:hypothetical protein [Candidatus Woesearchaeota archaeon]MBW3022111.1 hypothetical protein [Candidatus Woesearchaeota archaeon]